MVTGTSAWTTTGVGSRAEGPVSSRAAALGTAVPCPSCPCVLTGYLDPDPQSTGAGSTGPSLAVPSWSPGPRPLGACGTEAGSCVPEVTVGPSRELATCPSPLRLTLRPWPLEASAAAGGVRPRQAGTPWYHSAHTSTQCRWRSIILSAQPRTSLSRLPAPWSLGPGLTPQGQVKRSAAHGHQGSCPALGGHAPPAPPWLPRTSLSGRR